MVCSEEKKCGKLIMRLWPTALRYNIGILCLLQQSTFFGAVPDSKSQFSFSFSFYHKCYNDSICNFLQVCSESPQNGTSIWMNVHPYGFRHISSVTGFMWCQTQHTGTWVRCTYITVTAGWKLIPNITTDSSSPSR